MIKMGYGFTADDSDTVSLIIQSGINGRYSHCFVWFECSNGQRQYFESISKQDPTHKKTGVRGPLLMSNVRTWADDSRYRWLYEQEELPITEDEVKAAYAFAQKAVKEISYAPIQILRNELLLRLKLRISFGRMANSKRWTCSEFCSRIMPESIRFKVLPLGDVLYDDVVPSGRRGCGLMERVSDFINSDQKAG